MTRRLQSLALISCLALAGAAAQSLDFSLGTSLSYTQLATPSASGAQSMAVIFATPIGTDWKFTAGLSATLSASYDGASGLVTPIWPWTLAGLDLPEFDLSFSAPIKDMGLDRFDFRAGRFAWGDPTGSVYSHKLDGLSFMASYPLVDLGFVLGYTGFLSPSSAIIATTADTTYSDGNFAPPRAIGSFELRSPRLFDQRVSASITLQEDMRDQSQLVPEYETFYDSASSGPANSAYLSLGIDGSALQALTYSAYGVFEFGRGLSYVADLSSSTGYRYLFENLRAWAFGGTASYAINPSMATSLRFLYGSGDPDATAATDGNTSGDATQFVPIIAQPSGLVFSPDPANVTQIEIGFQYKPFPAERYGISSVLASSKTLVFLKNGVGPVSEAGILPGSGLGLLGIEEDVSGSVPVLTDVTLLLSMGIYLPSSFSYDASYVAKSPFEYSISAALSLAL